MAEDAEASGVRTNAADDAADEGGFAGAVGAEESKGCAGRNFEGDSGERGGVGVGFNDRVDQESRGRGCGQSILRGLDGRSGHGGADSLCRMIDPARGLALKFIARELRLCNARRCQESRRRQGSRREEIQTWKTLERG